LPHHCKSSRLPGSDSSTPRTPSPPSRPRPTVRLVPQTRCPSGAFALLCFAPSASPHPLDPPCFFWSVHVRRSRGLGAPYQLRTTPPRVLFGRAFAVLAAIGPGSCKWIGRAQLYVKGKLTNVEAVMIDIGTGYYIERVPSPCSSCIRASPCRG